MKPRISYTKPSITELEVGYALVRLVDTTQGGDLLDRISMIRRQIAGELGMVMPPVRIRDNMQLQPNEYHINIRGNAVAPGPIRVERSRPPDDPDMLALVERVPM